MAVIIVLGIASVSAQPIPPDPPGGTNTPPTQAQLDAMYAAWLANLSNNLASVSGWLHEGITNPDGTPADSMLNLMDSQAATFSLTAESVMGQQQSALDEALTWATAMGLPTVIVGTNGASSAYLMGREDGVPNYVMPFDLAAAITINTTNVWPSGSTGFSLTGTNTTISMWDEASPRLTHSEFTSRVSELDGITNLSSHSTAVAGVLSAAGANVIYSNGIPIGYAAKGMAYSAQVQARDFYTDAGEMIGAIGTNHMRLSNQSYGSVQGWYFDGSTWWWFGNPEISGTQDPKFGNYTTNAVIYDTLIQNAPTYLQVWAAGNSLSNGPPVQPTNHIEITLQSMGYYTNAVRPLDGDQGGYDTLSQQSCAKNILTVGAVFALPNGYAGPNSVVLAPFSSCGPTDDGRIKPDVVADGYNNVVPIAGSDYQYAFASGTSFAAPSVAGSIDLLAQLYNQYHPNGSGSSGKCVPKSRNHWKCDLSESPVRSGALRKASERPSSIHSKQSRCGRGFPIGRCRKANSFRQLTTSQDSPFA